MELIAGVYFGAGILFFLWYLKSSYWLLMLEAIGFSQGLQRQKGRNEVSDNTALIICCVLTYLLWPYVLFSIFNGDHP